MIAFGNTTIKTSSAPFLIELAEGANNEIKFVVALSACGELATDSTETGNTQVDEVLSACVPINADTDDRYEIVFESYVFYMVRNESYALGWHKDEIGKGDYFLLFEKSRLLDFLPHFAETEILEAYCQQGWQHYGILCQNHLIDVIAASEPKIRKL